MDLSTLSLILSIIGLFFPVFSVAGIVVGKKSLQQEGYSQKARAAIIIGWVGVGLWIISCCLTLLILIVVPLLSSQDSSQFLPTEPPSQPTEVIVPSQPTKVIVPTPDHSRWQLGIICEDRGGAMVVSVLPSSPADQMGIQKGDIIINVNRAIGITDCSQLREVIGSLKSGESLEIGILRGAQGEKEIIYLSTVVQ